MLLHLFYCVLWFWFLFDLILKSILKWLWKQIQMRKEKKKKKNLTCVAGGLEACPSRPAPSSLAVGPSGAESFLCFSSAPAWAGPGAAAATCFLFCVTDERTPHVSRVLLPLIVTELETNTTATKTNRVSWDLLPENVVVEL
jgi:hypothetical protein